MADSSKTPKLRFPGFCGDWEIRKLGNMFSFVRNKNKDGKNDNVITNSAEYGLIPQRSFFDKDIAVDGKTDNYTVIAKGDFVYNPRKSNTAPFGPFNCYKSDAEGIVSPLYTCLTPLNVEYTEYLLWYFKTSKWHDYILVHGAQSGARHDRVGMTNDLMAGIPISIPSSMEEQKKIGDYFTNLDNLITLHQRKFEKLKNIKKAMLQKMFPKNGEKIPEIRFSGFTGAWELRKLSECAGFRRGSFPQPYGNKDWYDGEGAMPFVQVADVSSDMKLVEDTKQKISKLAQPMSVFAEKGSVLVTLQGSIGRVAITQYGAFVDRTVLIFDKYNDDIDKRFWAYIIKEKFAEEARKAPGGTIKTITKEALSDFDLMLPSKPEQTQIGEYFLNLDNFITLHQRKQETLKTLKKGMLQQMFV